MRSVSWILSLAATTAIAMSIPYLVMGQSDGSGSGSAVWVDGPYKDCSSAFACTPVFCKGKENGTKCTNKDDCSSYGICIDGKEQTTKCPAGQRYDCTRRDCYPAMNVNCTADNWSRPYYTTNKNCNNVIGTDGSYPTGANCDSSTYLVVKNGTCREATCAYYNQNFDVWTCQCTVSPTADFYNATTCPSKSM